MGRVTIYDVAKQAGVSYQTVSRVLNDRPDVAEETRMRVQRIIAELDYVPYGAARRLGSGKHDAIGLLMWSLGHPYWSRLAHGAQRCCTDQGLGFLVGSSHGDLDEERRQVRIFLEHGVSGIALFPCEESEILSEIRRYDVPVVAIGGVRAHGIDAARVDDVGGTRAVTDLLLKQGHRRIGLLNGPTSSWQTIPREKGYSAALHEAGVSVDCSLIKNAPEFSEKTGAHMVSELLALEDPPTGLVAASPALARGMLEALAERGIRIPDDMAVAAYTDGSVLPESISYATCEPIEELGSQAARMLLDRLQGYTGIAREYVLGYQLHVGTLSG